MKFELESKARQDLQFKYDNEFKKLEEELQINKKKFRRRTFTKKKFTKEKQKKQVKMLMLLWVN